MLQMRAIDMPDERGALPYHLFRQYTYVRKYLFQIVLCSNKDNCRHRLRFIIEGRTSVHAERRLLRELKNAGILDECRIKAICDDSASMRDSRWATRATSIDEAAKLLNIQSPRLPL